MRASKADLLGLVPETREVEIAPGKTVTVKGMDARVRDEYDYKLASGQHVEFRVFTALRCIVDENGKPVYSDSDSEALGQVKVEVLDKIVAAANGLSDLDEESRDRAKKDSAASEAGPSGE